LTVPFFACDFLLPKMVRIVIKQFHFFYAKDHKRYHSICSCVDRKPIHQNIRTLVKKVAGLLLQQLLVVEKFSNYVKSSIALKVMKVNKL
jgi:hypothetical protein